MSPGDRRADPRFPACEAKRFQPFARYGTASRRGSRDDVRHGANVNDLEQIKPARITLLRCTLDEGRRAYGVLGEDVIRVGNLS
jgi:hypothetical protein